MVNTSIFVQNIAGENTLILPSNVSPSEITLYLNIPDNTMVMANGSLDSVQFHSGMTLNLTKLCHEDCYTITFCAVHNNEVSEFHENFLFSGNISTVYLTSDDPVNQGRHWVESSADKSNKATGRMILQSSDGAIIYNNRLDQIKGRGNSTWLSEKKPYQIKLTLESDLLQTFEQADEAKTWVLLANHFDPSLLRNALVLDIGNAMNMHTNMQNEYVDLYYDGEYDAAGYVGILNTDGEMLCMIEAGFQPDMVTFTPDGAKILVANDGDAREWGDEEAGTDFFNEIKETLVAADSTEAENIRVIDPEVTDGLPEGKAVLFGSRSFSIFRVDEDGLTQVFDSGKVFEALSAEYIPEYFNCSNDDNEYDSRSPKKGPEPESVTVGTIGNDLYAFIALERIGGIMVYKIDTEGETASFVNYINTRDFSENPGEAEPHLTSDVAPEGLYFSSENGILLAAFEVSGTVCAYRVTSTVVPLSEAATSEMTAPEMVEPTTSNIVEAAEPANTWMIVLAVIVVAFAAVVFVLKKKKQTKSG